MFKQLIIPMAAVAAFVIFVGILTQKQSSINLSKYLPSATPQEKTLTIGNKTIKVEVANTESAREKGLGGRSSLPKDTGLLFVFESKKVNPTFWMKDMQFPIDIIWIENSKVIKIDKNVPVPTAGTKDSSLTKYTAGKPVDYVLEVNSEFADTNNLKVGDSVTLPTL